jgi:hypothetical protein
MNVKIDTKERFTVITPEFHQFTAILSEEFNKMLLDYLTKPTPHVILNFKNIHDINEIEALAIIQTQCSFYEHNVSCVICEIQKSILPLFEDSPNITPTESEAWDILQMEEIERELLNDFEN